jgi:hypothetical protein
MFPDGPRGRLKMHIFHIAGAERAGLILPVRNLRAGKKFEGRGGIPNDI